MKRKIPADEEGPPDAAVTGRRTDFRTYHFSRRELVRYLAEGFLIGAAVVWLCYSTWIAMPAAAVVAVFYLRLKKEELGEQRRLLLTIHFRDFLSSLHTAMLAGSSLENGVRQAGADMVRLYGREDILSVEIAGIVRQLSFRQPVEALFRDLGARSGVEDIRFFGDILSITKKTGGDFSAMLHSSWRNLCEKLDTRQEIETVAAAARYEQMVMSLMPALIILYLRLTFDGFAEQMYGNLAGAAAMTAALVLYGAAFCLGRRMTTIQVI